MSNLEQGSGQPDEANGLTNIEREEQHARNLLDKRQAQLIKYGQQADEHRRIAGRYDELGQRTGAHIDTLSERLKGIEANRILYTESLVYYASSYREELFAERRKLQEARLRVEAKKLHPSIIEIMESKLAALEQQAYENPDLQRGMSLLEARERAEAEERRKKTATPTPLAPTPKLESPKTTIEEVDEDEEPLTHIMIRDIENGTFTLGEATIAYKPDSVHSFLLGVLPGNPTHDPEVGYTSHELDQRSIKAKVYRHNSSYSEIEKINYKFRKIMEKSDDFRIIKGQGERGKMKYSIDAEVFTPEEWELRQLKEETIDTPIELIPGQSVDIQNKRQPIEIELPNGEFMLVQGPNQARGARFVQEKSAKGETFTKIEYMIASKGDIDPKKLQDKKYLRMLSTDAKPALNALNRYYNAHNFEITPILEQKDVKAGKPQEYILKEIPTKLLEEVQEIERVAEADIIKATPKEAAEHIINIQPKDLGILVVRARKRLAYATSYEENGEVQQAERKIEDQIPVTNEPKNKVTIAHHLADAFMKIGQLYSLPHDQRESILAQYDQPTKVLLSWLTDGREKFREMFFDLYYPDILDPFDKKEPLITTMLYTLYNTKFGRTSKEEDHTLQQSKGTRIENQPKKILTIEENDPKIRSDIGIFLEEVGNRIPIDDSLQTSMIGDQVRAAIRQAQASFGTAWAEQSILQMLEDQGHIQSGSKKVGSGNYHTTYSRLAITKAWAIRGRGITGGINTRLSKQISDIIEDEIRKEEETRKQKEKEQKK